MHSDLLSEKATAYFVCLLQVSTQKPQIIHWNDIVLLLYFPIVQITAIVFQRRHTVTRALAERTKKT